MPKNSLFEGEGVELYVRGLPRPHTFRYELAIGGWAIYDSEPDPDSDDIEAFKETIDGLIVALQKAKNVLTEDYERGTSD